MEMMKDRITSMLEAVKGIAKEAGTAILGVYNSQDQGIESKKDNSPLTLADRESNRLICAHLRTEFAGIPIISEENKAIPFENRRQFDRFWLIDPLDGTKEFIKRNGEFTVNIALIEGSDPALGVVYIPVTGEMYWAAQGRGAWKVNADGGLVRLKANRFDHAQIGLRVVCSRSHLNEETRAYIEKLQEPEAVSRGSSLKFMLLAEGKAELYPRLAPTMEWDTAAAQCILEEAGGRVISRDDGKPLRYNKESLVNPFFIAEAKSRSRSHV